MARYFSNNFTTESSVDESSSSACALSSEAEVRNGICLRNDNSEVDSSEPSESALPSAKCAHHDKGKKTKAGTDFRISSKSAVQGALGTGSSKDLRTGKKRRMYGNGREVSSVTSFSDSDDDFKEPVRRFPSVQQTRKTSKDGQTGKSRQTVPCSYSSAETSGTVPARSELWFQPLEVDDALPSASSIKQSDVPGVSTSASGDEFGVYGLVDSFFDDTSPSKRQENKPNCGEPNSHLGRSEVTGAKNKHKPSSFSSSRAARSAQRAGNVNSEVQPNVTLDGIAGFFGGLEDNSNTGNSANPEDIDTSTVPSSGRVESRANALRRFRFRQKRTESDDNFFDRTFDVPDAQNEGMGQVGNSQSSSTAFFANGTLTNAVEGLECVSNVNPRSGKSASTSRPTRLTEPQLRTQSGVNSCIPSMGVDRMSTMGSRLRDWDCRDLQHQTGSLSATVSGVPNERAASESATTSNPFRQKRRGLGHTSSSASSNCSASLVDESDVQQNTVTSSRLISNQSKDAERKKPPRASHSRYELPAPAVENTRQSSAVGDRIHTRDRSGSYRMVQKRSRSRTDTDGHSQNDAAVHENKSDPRNLKRRVLHTRIADDDDAEGAPHTFGESSIQTDRNVTCDRSGTRHARESAATLNNSVVVIGSDDEVTSPAGYPPHQAVADSTDGQHSTSLEPSSSAAEGGLRRVRSKRTARMSTSGG